MRPEQKTSYWTEKKEEEEQKALTASYVIYKEEDTGIIYAKNGDTGKVDFCGTDAATVIQNAIDALPNGGYLHVKSGIYSISSLNISYKDGIKIVGDGWALLSEPSDVVGTVLKFTGSGDKINARYVRKLIMKDIAIVGDGNGNAIVVGSDGRSNHFNFQNVLITNFENGIYNDSDLTGLYDSSFIECGFYYCSNAGVTIADLENGFFRCTFRMNKKGIEILKTDGKPGLYNCVFSGNDYQIYTVGQLKGFEAVNCWFERCGEYSLGLGNGKLVYNDGTDRAIRQMIFRNCRIAKYEYIDLDWIYPTHRRKVVFDNCWFQVWDDWTTKFPRINEATMINCYRMDSIGAIYEYVTENSGSATITSGSTSVTVNHGLAGTPTSIRVTPAGDIGNVWVSNVDSTSFTINCSSAPTSDTTVYWYAEYKP